MATQITGVRDRDARRIQERNFCGRLGKIMIPSTLPSSAASNPSSSPSPNWGYVRKSISTFSISSDLASSLIPARTSSQKEVVPFNVMTEIRRLRFDDKYRAARFGRYPRVFAICSTLVLVIGLTPA